MFDTNILDTARTQRPRLVSAALTVLRAWHIAGVRVTVPPFGSFDAWSHCSRPQNQFSIFVRVDVAVQQSTAGAPARRS
jgi:hypothetical protein